MRPLSDIGDLCRKALPAFLNLSAELVIANCLVDHHSSHGLAIFFLLWRV